MKQNDEFNNQELIKKIFQNAKADDQLKLTRTQLIYLIVYIYKPFIKNMFGVTSKDQQLSQRQVINLVRELTKQEITCRESLVKSELLKLTALRLIEFKNQNKLIISEILQIQDLPKEPPNDLHLAYHYASFLQLFEKIKIEQQKEISKLSIQEPQSLEKETPLSDAARKVGHFRSKKLYSQGSKRKKKNNKIDPDFSATKKQKTTATQFFNRDQKINLKEKLETPQDVQNFLNSPDTKIICKSATSNKT